jgi:hypothetical protein
MNTLIALRAAGVPYARIARLLGVSTKTVFRWDKGLAEPSPAQLGRLQELLHILETYAGAVDKPDAELRALFAELSQPLTPKDVVNASPALPRERTVAEAIAARKLVPSAITGIYADHLEDWRDDPQAAFAALSSEDARLIKYHEALLRRIRSAPDWPGVTRDAAGRTKILREESERRLEYDRWEKELEEYSASAA